MKPRLMHLGAVCLIAALLVCAIPAAAQDGQRIVKKVVYEQRYFSDGRIETVQFFWDPARKIYIEHPRGSGVAETFDSALVERADTWRSNTKKIIFDFTEMSLPYRKNFKKIINKYCNRRRGVAGVPKFKAGKKTIPVKSLEDIGNFTLYQWQFSNDDHNVVCMTEDDLFFKNYNGQLNDPNVIARTQNHVNAILVKINGRNTGTWWIEEADVFLRSDFFEKSNYVQRVILAGSLRFALGYKKPIWTLDLGSDNRKFNEEMFEDANSALWKKGVEMWDVLYYSDTLVGISAKKKGYLDKARALPIDGTVLDLADYFVPVSGVGPSGFTQRTGSLFVTNLLAFDKNKTFSAEFKVILPDGVGSAEDVDLFTIQGNQYDYPGEIGTQDGGTEPWYPVFFLNSVKLGQQSDLTALNNAIQQYGTPLNMDGTSYSKAIKVQVEMEGYLNENSKAKKLTRTYYFVNTNN